MSRVTIVGPGRVGTLLATACSRAGHRVVAATGGSDADRRRISELVAGVRPEEDPVTAVSGADLVLLSVPDDALEEVVTELVRADALVEGTRLVHVSGSQGLAPLRLAVRAGARTAACHPAMTIPTGSTDPDLLVGTAWAVTAAPADRVWAHELVTELGGDPHDVPDDRRVLYHAGLAIGSNAVGAAAAVARQLLLAARIPDPTPFLAPLVASSVANILANGAVALTGPVVRGDLGTVRSHLAALEADLPALLDAYRALTSVVLDQAGPALGAEQVEAMQRMLQLDLRVDGRPSPEELA